MSDRCYGIKEPKTPQAKRSEAYLWRMLEMRGGLVGNFLVTTDLCFKFFTDFHSLFS
jgi:hypothetical protein